VKVGSLSSFYNLLYKIKCFRKMKSIFTFSKWTKKMSKIDLPKMSLLTKILCDDIEKLSSQSKLESKKLLLYFFCKNLKIFSQWKYMEILGNNFVAKNGTQKYCCKKCDYICYKKYNWNKHIMTSKHKLEINGSSQEMAKWQKVAIFQCNICNKQLKTNAGLWKHKQKCFETTKKLTELDKDELIITLLKQNAELIKGQQDMIIKLTENGINNTTNNNNTTNTHTNSHNKSFNLNFFLNETCKNAMNITDFVDSIKLQLSDLMEVGEIGYVEGISKIIVKNLNNLDETERPIHCTDKKRETMYVKDEGEWNKEDEKKTKLKKAITKIADKNIRLLPQFREKYPEYNNSSSKVSDKYDKIVIESMTSDEDKNEKIIKNISKKVIIGKNI